MTIGNWGKLRTKLSILKTYIEVALYRPSSVYLVCGYEWKKIVLKGMNFKESVEEIMGGFARREGKMEM